MVLPNKQLALGFLSATIMVSCERWRVARLSVEQFGQPTVASAATGTGRVSIRDDFRDRGYEPSIKASLAAVGPCCTGRIRRLSTQCQCSGSESILPSYSSHQRPSGPLAALP